jgi:hypothetical protein
VNTHAPTVDTGSPARLFAALVAIMLVFAGLFPDGARSLIPAPANSELIYDLGTRTKAVLPKFESGEQLHAQNDDLDGDLPRDVLAAAAHPAAPLDAPVHAAATRAFPDEAKAHSFFSSRAPPQDVTL